jgi:SAM-dependent methyltransferase
MMNPAEFANIARAEREMWWYEGMRRILFAMLDPLVRPRRIGAVLEAGCGTGWNARLLEQRYGWNVTALDLAADGLRQARELGLQRRVQADVAALPFAADSFDALVSLDLMVHLPPGAEVPAVCEMARVVRPGGLLVLRAAAHHFLRSRHSEFVGERQRYSRAKFLRLARESGLTPLRISYANCLLLPVALLKFRLWEPLFARQPRSGIDVPPAWLNRLLLAPLQFESNWLAQDRSLPAGQSIIMIAAKEPPCRAS